MSIEPKRTHYFHCNQIGIPHEMTYKDGKLLWFGNYTCWGHLKKDECVYQHEHRPFRLQNQYYDEETGLHYNFFRYYKLDAGWFVNQDPIRLDGGDNLYLFAFNSQIWGDVLGLPKAPWGKGSFDSWFDSANVADIRKVMADPNTKNAIPNALRMVEDSMNGSSFQWLIKKKNLGSQQVNLRGLQLLPPMYSLKIFLTLIIPVSFWKNLTPQGKHFPRDNLVEQVLSLILCWRINWKEQKLNVVPS